jgi:hypothetical protein
LTKGCLDGGNHVVFKEAERYKTKLERKKNEEERRVHGASPL